MPTLDANCVVGTLFQGSFPNPGPFVGQTFDVLVLCAKELQPMAAAYPKVRVLYCPLDDSGKPMTREEMRRTAKTAKLVRTALDLGQRCLVTCAMGLNRSGLVSALSLMMPVQRGHLVRTTPSCLSSDQAIALVRKARGMWALSNMEFVRTLARTDGICGMQRQTFDPKAFLPL